MSLTDEEKQAMLELHDGRTCIRPQSNTFDDDKFVVAVLWNCFATYQPTNKFEVTQLIGNVVRDWVEINDINTNERKFEVANDLDTYTQKLGQEIDMIETAIPHIRTLEDNGYMPIFEAQTSGCPTTVIDFLRDKPVPDRPAALRRYFLWRQVPLKENRVDYLLPLMKSLEYRRALVDETKQHLSLLRPPSRKQGAQSPSAKIFQSTKHSPYADNAQHPAPVETPTAPCLSSITAGSGEPAKNPKKPLVLDKTPQASAVTKSGTMLFDASTPRERPENPPTPKPPTARNVPKPIQPTPFIETTSQSSTAQSHKRKRDFEPPLIPVLPLEAIQAKHCQSTKLIPYPTTTNSGPNKRFQSPSPRQHVMNGKVVSAEKYYGFETIFELLAHPQKQTRAHVQTRPESMEQLLYGDMEQLE